MTNVKSRILPILALATALFLFASPAAVATAATNRSNVTHQLAPVPLTIGAPAQAGPAGTSCSSGGCTYVANYGSSSVSVIGSNNKVLTTITLPSGSCPIGVVYDASVKLVFVADDCLSQVEIINPKTNTLSSKVVSVDGAAFIACDDAVPACFVTQFGYGTVTPFNPKTLAVGSTVTQCSYYPEFITYDSKTGMLYVGNNYEGCITVENPKTGATSTITVGDEITGVAAVKSGEVYVDDGYYSEVYLVKGTTVVSTITNSGFSELWGNTANAKGTGVIVDSSASSQAYPITGTKVGTAITVGSYPNAACSSTKLTDVTNIESDTVTVISGTKVVTSVDVGTEPFGCAFN